MLAAKKDSKIKPEVPDGNARKRLNEVKNGSTDSGRRNA
jgi:hypothetical protein